MNEVRKGICLNCDVVELKVPHNTTACESCGDPLLRISEVVVSDDVRAIVEDNRSARTTP